MGLLPFLKHLIITFVHAKAGMCMCRAPMWRSKDNLQELVPSFHCVGLRNQTRVSPQACWQVPFPAEPPC